MPTIITVEGQEHDLEAMTRDELLKLKSQIDGSKMRIDSQLSDAKAKVHTTGQYADPDWYRRAQHAAKRMGRQSQTVQIELARQKSLQKERSRAEVPLSQYFLDVAREEMDSDDVREMLETAKRRREAAREKSDD